MKVEQLDFVTDVTIGLQVPRATSHRAPRKSPRHCKQLQAQGGHESVTYSGKSDAIQKNEP